MKTIKIGNHDIVISAVAYVGPVEGSNANRFTVHFIGGGKLEIATYETSGFPPHAYPNPVENERLRLVSAIRGDSNAAAA